MPHFLVSGVSYRHVGRSRCPSRIQVCKARTAAYESLHNLAMAIPQPPGQRKQNSATKALAALHGALAVFTLLACAFTLLSSLDDPHEACKYHGLYCDRGPHMREAVLIGVVGTVALVIGELLLLVLLRKHSRLSIVVPIVCFIGQFALLGVVFTSDNSVPTSR